jgi:hypothetical protein
VACAFEFRVVSGAQYPAFPPREWYLWRQPARVERQDIHQGESEVWRRGRDGQVFYERQFHHHKRIIAYVPGDLRALHTYPDWHKLLHVIDPTWLQRTLLPTGSIEVLGRHAQRYHGRRDGVEFEVLWLEAEQLPALVRHVSPDREEVLRLREIYPFEQAPWPRFQTEQYQRLDTGQAHLDYPVKTWTR